MAPLYKVRYFDMRGRAEPIRMLLSYGKIPFEDDRISKEDWPKIKPTVPQGRLPILEIDGRQIPQSIPICRYLGRLLNISGNDDLDNISVDVAVETFLDIQALVRENKDIKKVKEELSFYFGIFEEHFKKHGGYAASNKFTWADIIFINTYELLMNVVGEDVFDPYPTIQQLKKTVLSQEGIRDWIRRRPKDPNTKYDLKQDI